VLKDRASKKVKYFSFNEMIKMIDQPNRSACLAFIDANKALLTRARGSKTKHQAWKGGYIDHLTETMNIAIVLYDILNSLRPLTFSLSDSLLVLFLHDVEKPWKQQHSLLRLEDAKGVKDYSKIKKFKARIIEEYKFRLTKEHLNAIAYAEGEGLEYDPRKRVQGPLAAFVHMCDVWSARGWYDYPMKRNDPWIGALRSIMTA
jgi:hypothetical protein